MDDSATDSCRIDRYLELHRCLLAQAEREVGVAFDVLGLRIGELVDSGTLGSDSELARELVVSMQAADAVAQRLQHVKDGLALLAAANWQSFSEDDERQLVERIGKLFTIASETRQFAALFPDAVSDRPGPTGSAGDDGFTLF